MSKRLLYTLVMCILILFWIVIRLNAVTRNEMNGVYVNRNFDYSPFLVEIPYQADTLTLLSNGQYESEYWGGGSYKLKGEVNGRVVLAYEQDGVKCEYSISIQKDYIWSKPKLVLYEDKNHFYEKVE